MLIRAAWPERKAAHKFPDDAAGVDAVVRLIAAVRGIRVEQGLRPGAKVEVEVHAKTHAEILRAARAIVARQVQAESLAVAPGGEAPRKGAAVAVDPAFEVAVRLGEADRAAEKARLSKQLESERRRLAGFDKRLRNEDFLTRAKPEAVAKARSEAEKLRTTISSIEERLAALE